MYGVGMFIVFASLKACDLEMKTRAAVILMCSHNVLSIPMTHILKSNNLQLGNFLCKRCGKLREACTESRSLVFLTVSNLE